MVSTRHPSLPFAIKLYNLLDTPWEGDKSLSVTAIDESGRVTIKVKAMVTSGTLQPQTGDPFMDYIDMQLEQLEGTGMKRPFPAVVRYLVSLVLSGEEGVKILDEFEGMMDEEVHLLDMIGIISVDQEIAQCGDIIRYLFAKPISTDLVLERSDYLRASLTVGCSLIVIVSNMSLITDISMLLVSFG
jgi:hypothetical protein